MLFLSLYIKFFKIVWVLLILLNYNLPWFTHQVLFIYDFTQKLNDKVHLINTLSNLYLLSPKRLTKFYDQYWIYEYITSSLLPSCSIVSFRIPSTCSILFSAVLFKFSNVLSFYQDRATENYYYDTEHPPSSE